MTCRMPAAELPHRLDPGRPIHPGPLGELDRLVDAVEQHNLDEGPETPVPARLMQLAEQMGVVVVDSERVRRWHSTAGSALHDALMLAQEPHVRRLRRQPGRLPQPADPRRLPLPPGLLRVAGPGAVKVVRWRPSVAPDEGPDGHIRLCEKCNRSYFVPGTPEVDRLPGEAPMRFVCNRCLRRVL